MIHCQANKTHQYAHFTKQELTNLEGGRLLAILSTENFNTPPPNPQKPTLQKNPNKTPTSQPRTQRSLFPTEFKERVYVSNSFN